MGTIEVTQRDREAFKQVRMLIGEMAENMLAQGVWDDDPVMQILARHRQPDADVERVAGLQIAHGIVDADLEAAKETGDADWIGQSKQALASIEAAIAAMGGQSDV